MGFKGKKVLVTGHTGFKGTYLCKALLMDGASVYGYALPAKVGELYSKTKLSEDVSEELADIRDLDNLMKFFKAVNPDYVLHLAAQPLVLEGYNNPHYTYETNVMGTVNVLECIKQTPSVTSFVNVTTDKVYENLEEDHAFKEDEKLDGNDPYSNSKSCSDIITHAYKKSFFPNIAISTVRAGNVIGGGDVCDNRIIPDCIRAVINNKEIIIRNPKSVRPYQYVLEPILAYMQILEETDKNKKLQGSYNVGPNKENCQTTEDLVKKFVDCWGNNAKCTIKQRPDAPKEAGILMLDNQKVKDAFGIEPILSIDETIERTVNFYKGINEGKNVDKMIEDEVNYVKGRK